MISVVLLGLMLATSQAETERALSVAEVREMLVTQRHEGEIVRVRGFISKECYRFSCALLSEKGNEDSERLSIAGGTAVEKRLVARRGKSVVLRVRLGTPAFYVTANGEYVITTDRAPEIIPIEIED